MMNKLRIITLLLLLLSGELFAQGQLKQQLKKSKPDTSRLRILNNLGMLYKSRRHGKSIADLDTASSYFLQALPLTGLVPDSSKYSKNELLMNLGEIAIGQHNIEEARKYFMQAITYFQTKHEIENEAKAWLRLGDDLSFITKNSSPYFHKAIGLYEKLNKPDRIVYANYLLALDKQYGRGSDSAENISLHMIDRYKSTKVHNLELAYCMVSFVNRINGNLDKALLYAIGGLRRMAMVNDTTRGGTLYMELGQVYQATGERENSIYYYKKAIFIRERLNAVQQAIFGPAGFVVQQLLTQKKASEGLKYITELESRHPPDSEFEAAYIAQIKASCYVALRLSSEAEKNYVLMMKGFSSEASGVGTQARVDIARFYIDQRKPAKAAYYIKDRLSHDVVLAKQIELLHFKIDSMGGDLQSAIKHFQRYKIINDSIFSESKIKQIEHLRIAYETEKKDNDIKFFKVDRLVQVGKVNQANYMRNVTLAGIVVLILFLAFLYNGYRFKQRKNESLNLLVTEKDGLLIEKDSLLQQKQWLLKEIHHRVKNNLAIVMGLLNRQSAYIDNEVALAAIQNSQNRMRSIALIHQKLYQSECLDLILMPDYIDELIGHLKDSFDLGNRIIFEKQIAELYLDVSQAVPLGLIINEAITNSIKYAYPDQAQGVISVTLSKGENDENVLRIKDNGPGLKSGFDSKKADSMGTNLMRGLSKQLGGALEMTDDQGVLIKVVFKTEVFVATSTAAN
jgi:two-component sensor histidine kinase